MNRAPAAAGGGGGASSRRQKAKMRRRSSTGSGVPLFSPTVQQRPIDEDRIDDENEEWDRRLSAGSASLNEGSPAKDPPPVPAAGRRLFRRANSVNGTSEAPKAPPMLRRSQSVTTASMRSGLASMAADSHLENSNPNFDIGAFEDSVSPKRVFSSSIGGGSTRGRRKKSKPASFFHNDFAPLDEKPSAILEETSSNISRSNLEEFDSPLIPTVGGMDRRRVLQRGFSLPDFPSPCFG